MHKHQAPPMQCKTECRHAQPEGASAQQTVKTCEHDALKVHERIVTYKKLKCTT
jgi:hypothetical protein